MTLSEALQHIFPQGRAPRQRLAESELFSVVGLPAGVEPEACEILLQGAELMLLGTRIEHYLVKIGGWFLLFQICTALPDKGYAEFAVGRALRPESEDAAQDFIAYARRKMAAWCGE
jgi:hypothetical protein